VLDASGPVPTKQKHQTVHLSAFDIIINITGPTSPVSDAALLLDSTIMMAPRPTRPGDQCPKSPPRTRSPTPSLISISACSSNDIPTTATDVRRWRMARPQPYLQPHPAARKVPPAQCVKIHPLVISKSTTAASSANALEFTLADLEGERTDEAEMPWYACELSRSSRSLLPARPPAAAHVRTRTRTSRRPIPVLPPRARVAG
jgi:hypothetical protein